MLKEQKKSPLKNLPLHFPGQYLAKKYDNLVNDKGMFYLSLIFLALSFTMGAWFTWYYQSISIPYKFTFLLLLILIFCSIKLKKIIIEARNYHLGQEGEQLVGMDLELLMLPYKVILHDIVNPKGNIDHILITQKGVYTIETKTWRKLRGKVARISFDGNNFLKDGHKFDYNSTLLNQPLAEALFIKNLLGNKIKIQPIILFPGWFIDQSAIDEAKKKGVWLLVPKMLEAFIKKEDNTINTDDISRIANIIISYIRGKDKKEKKSN